MDSISLGSPKPSAIADSCMSPKWDDVFLKYMEQNTKDGAYATLLDVLQEWKKDNMAASRVTAFMKLDQDIKCYPASNRHFSYQCNKETPLHMVFFGEVAPTNAGTSMGG